MSKATHPLTTAAQDLHSTLEGAHLHILLSRTRFEHDSNSILDDGDGIGDGSDTLNELRDPAAVAADVVAHISFLRKLKFQYLEHSAKDKYIKSIVSDIDDAPIVTADDNKELNLVNTAKKATLKEAKVSLADRYADIARLAPLVEQDYTKAHTLTTKATTLSQKILDARLALTRLRQSYPHPRLTIPIATSTLEKQIVTMQSLDDEVQELSKQVSNAKERLRGAKGEMEQVRTERVEVEKAAAISTGRLGDDDSRLMPLYDWYTASLAIHHSLTSLLSSHSVSENELRLTYLIPTSAQTQSAELTITLLFLPNTRQLAAANVLGMHPDIDISEVVDSHVQVGDVQGLVAAILARARAGA